MNIPIGESSDGTKTNSSCFLEIMFRTIKELISRFTFFAVLLPALIWLAVFSYISFYYSYIPVLHFTKPLYFLRTNCDGDENFQSSKSSSCLSARAFLDDNLLQPGIDYSFYLEMEVPESETNKQIGMFEVRLHILTKNKDVMLHARKLTIMEYKSWLHGNLETLIFLPFYLFTNARQTETMSVFMAGQFGEDTYSRSHEFVAEIRHGDVQVYSSAVHVYARFLGIRYFMYFWPLTTATFGISTVLAFFTLVLLASCYTHLQYRNRPAVFPQVPIKLEGQVDSSDS